MANQHNHLLVILLSVLMTLYVGETHAGDGIALQCEFAYRFGNLTVGTTHYMCCSAMTALNGRGAAVYGAVQSPLGDLYSVWAGVSSETSVCPPKISKTSAPTNFNNTARDTYAATFTADPQWSTFNTFFAVKCLRTRFGNDQCYLLSGAQVWQAS